MTDQDLSLYLSNIMYIFLCSLRVGASEERASLLSVVDNKVFVKGGSNHKDW